MNTNTAIAFPSRFGQTDVRSAPDKKSTGKKVAMMQPYLFPYLGYFQLIASVDQFVIGDDLQYVKASWMNRNRILVNGKDRMITFPLRKESHLLEINQRHLCPDFQSEMDALLRVLAAAYRKAPRFRRVFPLIEEILRTDESNLAKFTTHSLHRLCEYMQIVTPFVVASDLHMPRRLEKQERIIRIERMLGGNVYINPIGGAKMYYPDRFAKSGLALRFLRMDDVTYRQFDNAFVPDLSIIDVLMFNGPDELQKLLCRYSLIPHPEGDCSLGQCAVGTIA